MMHSVGIFPMKCARKSPNKLRGSSPDVFNRSFYRIQWELLQMYLLRISPYEFGENFANELIGIFSRGIKLAFLQIIWLEISPDE